MQPGLVRIREQMVEAFHRGDAAVAEKRAELENVHCLGAFYDAMGRGDIDAALGMLADDSSYAIYSGGPQPFRMAGRGRVEVEEGIRRNFGVITFEHIEVGSLSAQGELVMLVLRQRGHWRHNGEEFDERALLEFSFRGGRIIRYRGWLMPYLA